jgi:hypothetical protein
MELDAPDSWKERYRLPVLEDYPKVSQFVFIILCFAKEKRANPSAKLVPVSISVVSTWSSATLGLPTAPTITNGTRYLVPETHYRYP